MILSPSILAADFAILGQQIEEVDKAGAEYIHIDVMDGLFVPSISFGMPLIASIRKVTKKIFDVHLMIVDPMRYLEDFAKSGADGITIHLESYDLQKDPEYMHRALRKIRQMGLRAGLTIKPGTPVAAIEPYLKEMDMFLLMTVEPGFGGQTYIESSTKRIVEAKKRIVESGYPIDIEVDGGITRENLQMVLDAGANVIVAGSALFQGNIAENMKNFRL